MLDDQVWRGRQTVKVFAGTVVGPVIGNDQREVLARLGSDMADTYFELLDPIERRDHKRQRNITGASLSTHGGKP